VSIDARSNGAEVVLVVHGSLNQQEVGELQARVADLEPGARVTIDLREVRVCDDAAVAALARGLGRGGGPAVELVGLSDHHHRVLRYMGVRAPRRSWH
jgi:anti-anti-sigma regulatory factor